jgi:hypothetical protein
MVLQEVRILKNIRNMVILKSKISKIRVGYYALVKPTSDAPIETQVAVFSGSNCVNWADYLCEIEESKDITALHKAELIKWMHNGNVLPTKMLNDTSIGIDNIDVSEVYSFVAGMGLDGYFLETDTLDDMVNKIGALGFCFQRKTSNNI